MDFQNIYEIVIDKLYLWIKTFITMLPNIGVAVLVVVAFFLIGKLHLDFGIKGGEKLSEIINQKKNESK
jgi:hypothetical protein